MTPKLSSRISKLVPRLASDADGEVLATVRAIRISLQAEGFDLHDLAARVDNGGGAFPVAREPFRWSDPAAERSRGEAWSKEAAQRKAEQAAKCAETLEKNKAAKAKCEGKGDRAPTWEMLMQQPNRIALIGQWLDWFIKLDISPAERERAADLRQAVKFDRLGMRPDAVRRFNGWLVRTLSYTEKWVTGCIKRRIWFLTRLRFRPGILRR